ncbi:MAG TPA: Ppx/GppA phosphatase family protein [Vicinamibacteria bacterium]|nr:Ppx/GppA phosphatase family protein [Vicinamibacteria bacterium]
MPDQSPAGEDPVAVIDIGSNSGRVVVYRPEAGGGFRILAGTRAALRLVREVDGTHALSAATIDRTLDALRDFKAIAVGAGARRSVAVATAALRDAENAPALLARVREELGVEVRIISGEEEAWYGFLGAVHGLPVEHGVLFDLGGGSMQVSHFQERALRRSVSLPLGSLRLSDAFLGSDPPKAGEVRHLQAHVREMLERERLAPLAPGEALVGTGGTVRNLAKVDRVSRAYPLTRLHGYLLSRRRVHEIATLLAARRLKHRRDIPGLNEDRGDSIVGGSLAVQALMDLLQAREVLVSGEGVREGLVLGGPHRTLPPPQAVREASVTALTARFAVWNARAADRRAALAAALQKGLEPGTPAEIQEALRHAARLLDVGRSVDFFDRHEHVADMVLATDMAGFSHRDLGLLSSVLRHAGDEDTPAKRLAPLVTADDIPAIERAAVVLRVADDIEERCPPGQTLTLECQRGPHEVTVVVPQLVAWRPRKIGPRFERAFGRALIVGSGPRGQS